MPQELYRTNWKDNKKNSYNEHTTGKADSNKINCQIKSRYPYISIKETNFTG